MIDPLTFRNVPIINYLSTDKRWTVSDKDKRPINAKKLLETGDLFGAREESELVTLIDLDNDPNLQAVNRTYRLNARHNNIIMIDVEPEASNEMKNFAYFFPAHFTELSMNGGVHLLIHVPDDCITDDNRYMFTDLSVFKEPIPDGENRPAHYEVLFNDHYVTFTKKAVMEKPSVDFDTDLEAKAKLVNFLDEIVKLDKERKNNRELAKQNQIDIFEESITDEKHKQIVKFTEIRHLDTIKQRAMNRSLEDYGGDHSRYEMSLATAVAGGIWRTSNIAKTTVSYRDILSTFTDQDYVYAVYLIIDDVIPHRNKHDEYRDGLPWLMYIARNAYSYIVSQEKERKEQKNK